MSIQTAPEPSGLTGGRPPVEHRLLGLDRRTFKLPLIAVAAFVLWAVVSPAVNKAIDYDDPVRAGDQLIIGPSTTMAPPVGWGVESGVRVNDGARTDSSSQARAVLIGDGIAVSTQTGPFDGDAPAFVKQLVEVDKTLGADSAFTVKGRLRTLSIDGRRGVAQEFKQVTGEGAIFGFVEDGVGIAIVVSGSDDALSGDTSQLGQMLASIDFDAEAL